MLRGVLPRRTQMRSTAGQTTEVTLQRAARVFSCAALVLGVTTALAAESGTKPFKLGTFDAQGRMFVGAVLDDSLVIDLGAAATALKRSASAPRDMRDLIARYDSGGRDLITA